MSDNIHMHDDAPHQDWQGGGDWPEAWANPYRVVSAEQSSQPSQDASGEEREAGYSEYHMTVPPLSGASLERLEACRRSLVIAYLGKGFSLREAGHIADIAVKRLQEWLE